MRHQSTTIWPEATLVAFRPLSNGLGEALFLEYKNRFYFLQETDEFHPIPDLFSNPDYNAVKVGKVTRDNLDEATLLKLSRGSKAREEAFILWAYWLTWCSMVDADLREGRKPEEETFDRWLKARMKS